MDKNKFTIQQILFLLFSLFIAPFAFAGGGGDGLSCETAYEVTVAQAEDFSFSDGQEKTYMNFNASSDSMLITISNPTNSPFSEIIEVEVRLLEECGNTTLVYNKVVADSSEASFFIITELEESQDYLLTRLAV